MINEIQIPQSFEDIALEKGRMLALSPIQMGAYMMGADDAYRHLNSKPSGLGWVKASIDCLPTNEEKQVPIKFEDGSYATGNRYRILYYMKLGHKNLKWLDEGLTGNTTHNG